ncbi:MAG TPA: ATP-binding protein [Kiritimatiellia bacterium]|nr:ATP-binding protein [Kiritimatiellia bacterium]HSA18422.1 ATP-binding protein [Kiritimatiellia bacterium]
MTPVQVTLVLTLALNLALGVFVLATQPGRATNRVFFMLSLVLAAWLVGVLFITMAASARWASFWIRQAYAVALLIPMAGDYLRQAVVDHGTRRLPRIRGGWGLWFATVFIAGLCQTGYFLAGVQMPGAGQGLPYAVYGPGLHVFTVYYLAAWFLLLLRLIRDARGTSGIVRAEICFILLGLPSGLMFGVLCSIILPMLTSDYVYAALSPLSLVFLDASIAYGIATRRIMEATELLRRVTAYALLTAYLLLLYLAVWFPVDQLTNRVYGPSLLPHMAAALALAFSLAPVHGRLQRFSARLFINARPLNVATVVQRTTRLLDSIGTLRDLLQRFAHSISQAVDTDRVVILLLGPTVYEQHYPDPAVDGSLSLKPEDALAQVVREHGGPLSIDLVERIRPSALLTAAAARLKDLRAAISVRIHSKEGLEGLLLLGPRLSGRIYGAVEQEALQILCNQLAVALENARLYTQIQNSKIYHEILLDNLVSGVIAVNAERVITVFNHEAQRITRLQPADVLGQPLSVLPEPLAAALQKTLDHGQGRRDQDAVLVPNPGEETPIRLGSSVFHGHTGQALGALVVFSDMTALRRLEMQVRRTDRLASLGTLVAGMAHEIKNPLVSIKTFTQLLPERYDDPEFRTTLSKLAGDEIQRIDAIVNQLLHFSRPARPNLVPLALHQVLHSTLQLVAQQAHRRGINLAVRLEAARDRVRADANQLNQAFVNILLNGMDAIRGEGGVLIVSTDNPECPPYSSRVSDAHDAGRSFIRVCVTDTGEGISRENLARVFDPFFTTKDHGTGLGLSVAHGIIADHAGLVDVSSDIGRGTTFSLYFPLLPEEATAA